MRKRRTRLTGWASALAAGLVTAPAWAQSPVPPTGPVPCENARPVGPIRRAFHHMCFTLQDQVIGYPEQFSEPPMGFYLYETMGMMKARADTHDFILYRSDFVAGTTTLSPIGAQRLSLMAARLPGWLGPVYVEWTPDKPGLADTRKDALVATLQKAGIPIVAERVLVGPSPYHGALGTDASNFYQNLILRDQDAALNFSRTPTSTSAFGSGAR
jgi:hypothetical protein